MVTQAKITSKGQITIPKAVREALGLVEGNTVVNGQVEVPAGGHEKSPPLGV
jgi:AbrB family looped-hinge helix DNA binding protein